MDNGSREPKRKSPEQALASLMRYSSRAERSSGDALRLMKKWGIGEKDQRDILARLTEQRFIDDERFAQAYYRDKTEFAGWGVYKIKSGLRAKGISSQIIERLFVERDDSASTIQRLTALLQKRSSTLKGGTVYDRKAKLVRYGLSRGYPYDDVLGVVDKIVKDNS